MNNLTNLTVKDVYFNLLTPTDERIAMEQDNDTYLATIALDNGIRLSDSINKANKVLKQLNYEPITFQQNQNLRMKSFILENWLKVNGYSVDSKKVDNFVHKNLAKMNIDYYFISKYLNLNNNLQLERYLERELKKLEQIDLTNIISLDA